jgi:hypothetical protein
VTVDGQPTEGTRILLTGPRFFTAMQIPILRGREIVEEDERESAPAVAVVSDLFARTNFDELLTIVGIAANAQYGELRDGEPPVVYIPYARLPAPRLGPMTYALRTEGGPLRYAPMVRQIVGEADSRVPVANLKTQVADINQTINQEIIFARLCTAFAILALLIACVGLYATMAYAVVRRTREIGLRMALGAKRGAVLWMILRQVCVIVAVGLAIAIPIATVLSRLVESFLFRTSPNDPRTLILGAVILVAAAVVAGYGPASRASRVEPMVALRHE